MGRKPNFEYPIVADWNKEELIKCVAFFEQIEKAYGEGVDRQAFLKSLRDFQRINPAKVEPNNLLRTFKERSGLDYYPVIKMATTNSKKQKIKL